MSEDKIKSNKFLNIQPLDGLFRWPVINVIYAAMGRFTGYHPPAEEKEHVIIEIPGPDFEIRQKDS